MKKLLLFFIAIPLFVSGQETETQKIRNNLIVTGKIIDSNGLPLIGAKINAKGTTKETTTNFDGKFSLEVEDETILYINFVDFKQIEVLVEPQTNIIFILKENNSKELATGVTRKEMRKIKRDNKKHIQSDGSNLVETLFYTLKSISD